MPSTAGPMLLTLKPPNQNDFRSSHDYPSLNSSSSRYSPPPTLGSSSGISDTTDSRMSQPHRGLPPPAAMTLPPPTSNLPAMAPLGQLPAPPSQWAGADESMRNWLHAKAEEDKRRQEEEKTKQETMRLDQRRIEQNMLIESLQRGVPPVMVPLIFAGMGGGNLPNQSLEWAQHYMAQMSLQQQTQQQQVQAQQQAQQVQLQQQQQLQLQQQQPPPPLPPPSVSTEDIRRDNRMVTSTAYSSHQQIQPALSVPTAGQSQQMPAQAAQTALARQAAGPRTSTSSGSLSRLNTNEIQIQGPPTSQATPLFTSQGAHSLQQTQTVQQESQQAQSSPNIYFHHWVPPNTSASQNPPTPSTKSQHGSPFSQNAPSHLRSDYQNSPKKRKATGSHHAPPAPTSQPESSPQQYSQASSRDRESPPGHRREREPPSRRVSDESSTRGYGGQPIARPSSRQTRHEQGGEGERGRSNRQAGGSSASTSGDETQIHMRGVTSETRQSRYPAGPEMRERPPKREDM